MLDCCCLCCIVDIIQYTFYYFEPCFHCKHTFVLEKGKQLQIIFWKISTCKYHVLAVLYDYTDELFLIQTCSVRNRADLTHLKEPGCVRCTLLV